MEWHNQTALITGASSGIGAATARALADGGAHVLLMARRRAALEEVAGAIRSAGGRASVYPADATDPAGVAEQMAALEAASGTPAIVVNNAGGGRWRFVTETEPQEAQDMIAAPYLAAFYVTRACLPGMLARGSGRIVNVSSAAGRFVWPGATGYIAARWAMRGFTEALRADLVDTGIGVTLFEAATVRSTFWAHNPGSYERLPRLARLLPEVTPEEAGHAIRRGIERGRRSVVMPRLLRLLYGQQALTPGLFQWLVTRSGYRPAA